jgi:type I restriction enzyme R subunit
MIALYDNLENNEQVALNVHDSIIKNKPDGWRGNKMKEKTVKITIKTALKESNIDDEDLAEELYRIATKQDEY